MTDGSDSETPGRTDLAEDRTLLATERTYASWLRTALAGIGIAVGFRALFRAIEPAWVPGAIASVLIGMSLCIVIAAERRAARTKSRLSSHAIAEARVMNLRLITAAVVLVGLALIGAMWLFDAAA